MTDSAAAIREMCVPLIREARERGLMIFHGGLSGPLWFTADELEQKQAGGKFCWGPVNWRLMSTEEYLNESSERLSDAQHEHERRVLTVRSIRQ